MTCPGCGGATTAIPLTDRTGADIEIDVCNACHAFWFDQYENIRLGAGATLKLFEIMASHDPGGQPLTQAMKCPRCGSHLLDTHDMQQRGTMFEYWRCPHAHGHFITFLQFLKEKDFVRPMTPEQIAELRGNVQTLNCANCGAPIDLAKGTVCAHCGSPLTMLDMKQIAAHVHELQQQASPSADVEIAKQFAAAVATMAVKERTGHATDQPVWNGLRSIVDWLAKKD